MKYVLVLFAFLFAVPAAAQFASKEHVIIDTLASESSLTSREFSGYEMLFEIYGTTVQPDTLSLEQKIATKTATGYEYTWLPAPLAEPVDTSGTIILDGVLQSFTPKKQAHFATYRFRRGTLLTGQTIWIKAAYFRERN